MVKVGKTSFGAVGCIGMKKAEFKTLLGNTKKEVVDSKWQELQKEISELKKSAPLKEIKEEKGK